LKSNYVPNTALFMPLSGYSLIFTYLLLVPIADFQSPIIVGNYVAKVNFGFPDIAYLRELE
jgi:hypothetical protein